MTTKSRNANLGTILFVQITFAALLAFWILAATVVGQTAADEHHASLQNPAENGGSQPLSAPVLKNYKDVAIGMTDKEVRERLGKPEVDDKDGFYYEISKNESVQIGLDANKKVRVISVMYTGKENSAPKFADVFGKDAALEEKADKSIYKLVRYPQAGFWVAYSRTAGDSPIITVTMQSIPLESNDQTAKSQ